ncbi:hypothetical protein FQN55_004027 [Onygenales sp. PD_40]|nr:hypothetical protein FQN55_004027 [Onygenales sp. PD_40]KAK2775127.1 hypothetical protein FQN53_003308 [Emmonsiellopsis sp. PD_33]KAK2791443.1 hypothetical protein FQN52_004877 [Onygenales sp. PD_12]
MAESYTANIPKHRLRWPRSELYTRDLRAQIDGALDVERRANSNLSYAMGYYRQPIRMKLPLVIFTLVVLGLHVGSVFSSDAFIKYAKHGEGVNIALLILGLASTLLSLWFQLQDRLRPCLRAKLIHSVCSWLNPVLYIALSLYNLGTVGSMPGFKSHGEWSALLSYVTQAVMAGGSLQLLLKGATGRLGPMTFADYFRLIFLSTPPDGAAWASLPEEERLWAERERQNYLASRLRESQSAGPSSVGTSRRQDVIHDGGRNVRYGFEG